MSQQLNTILVRKKLLQTRCALERLELRTAMLDLKSVQPLRAAGRAMLGPRLRSRLVDLVVIAIGSTRLKRASRWLARGLLAYRAWTLLRAVRAARASEAPGRTGAGAGS